MAHQAVMACSASGWQAERHVFFGTPEMIAEKIQHFHLGAGRRLFYATVEHGGAGKVYEYEHKQDGTYGVKIASVADAESFNHAVESAMHKNKGRSCVAEAVHALPEFKNLKFQPLTEVTVRGDHHFSELLPLDKTSEHAVSSADPSARFTRASFHILC